jgi:hypothetical protein
MPPLFPFKGCFKSFLDKPLPDPFYPPPMHTGPLRYRLIGISLTGKQQCLCPASVFERCICPD